MRVFLSDASLTVVSCILEEVRISFRISSVRVMLMSWRQGQSFFLCPANSALAKRGYTAQARQQTCQPKHPGHMWKRLPQTAASMPEDWSRAGSPALSLEILPGFGNPATYGRKKLLLFGTTSTFLGPSVESYLCFHCHHIWTICDASKTRHDGFD